MFPSSAFRAWLCKRLGIAVPVVQAVATRRGGPNVRFDSALIISADSDDATQFVGQIFLPSTVRNQLIIRRASSILAAVRLFVRLFGMAPMV